MEQKGLFQEDDPFYRRNEDSHRECSQWLSARADTNQRMMAQSAMPA